MVSLALISTRCSALLSSLFLSFEEDMVWTLNGLGLMGLHLSAAFARTRLTLKQWGWKVGSLDSSKWIIPVEGKGLLASLLP